MPKARLLANYIFNLNSMSHIKYFCLLFCCCFNAYCQDTYSEVRYTFTITNTQSSINVDCSLLYSAKQNQSTFINFGFSKTPDSTYAVKSESNGDQLINISKYNNSNGQKPEYQKLFGKDSLYAFESVYGEKNYHIIYEKLPHFAWKIENETKEILNHKVQKASVYFRGRNYTAWFAQDISIPDGPYKFNGLPGLILEISSTDGNYKFLAYELRINQPSDFVFERLTTKYKKNKILSVKEKIALTKANEEKEIRYQQSKNPNQGDFKLANTAIETDFKDLVDD